MAGGRTSCWSAALATRLALASIYFCVSVAALVPIEAERALSEARTALAQERSQFERWCNRTLLAQQGRHAALKQLLEQAQSASEGGALQVQRLEGEAADLGEALERARLDAGAADREREQGKFTAELAAEDSSRDVDALHRALNTVKTGGDLAQAALGALLHQAEEAARQLKEQAQLLQIRQVAGAGAHEVGNAEAQYRTKHASVEQAHHQYHTTQRSLDVLTAAMEDESAYLADLREVCEVAHEAYDRVAKDSLASLQQAYERAKGSPDGEGSLALHEAAVSAAPAHRLALPGAALAEQKHAEHGTKVAANVTKPWPARRALRSSVKKAAAAVQESAGHEGIVNAAPVGHTLEAKHGAPRLMARKAASVLQEGVRAKGASTLHKRGRAVTQAATGQPAKAVHASLPAAGADADSDSDSDLDAEPQAKAPTAPAARKLRPEPKKAQPLAAKKVVPAPKEHDTAGFDDDEDDLPVTAPKKQASKKTDAALGAKKHAATSEDTDEADTDGVDDKPAAPLPAAKKSVGKPSVAKVAAKKPTPVAQEKDAVDVASDDDEAPPAHAPTKLLVKTAATKIAGKKAAATQDAVNSHVDDDTLAAPVHAPKKPLLKAGATKTPAKKAAVAAQDATDIDGDDDMVAAPAQLPHKPVVKTVATKAPAKKAAVAAQDAADLDGDDDAPAALTHASKKPLVKPSTKKATAAAQDAAGGEIDEDDASEAPAHAPKKLLLKAVATKVAAKKTVVGEQEDGVAGVDGDDETPEVPAHTAKKFSVKAVAAKASAKKDSSIAQEDGAASVDGDDDTPAVPAHTAKKPSAKAVAAKASAKKVASVAQEDGDASVDGDDDTPAAPAHTAKKPSAKAVAAKVSAKKVASVAQEDGAASVDDGDDTPAVPAHTAKNPSAKAVPAKVSAKKVASAAQEDGPVDGDDDTLAVPAHTAKKPSVKAMAAKASTKKVASVAQGEAASDLDLDDGDDAPAKLNTLTRGTDGEKPAGAGTQLLTGKAAGKKQEKAAEAKEEADVSDEDDASPTPASAAKIVRAKHAAPMATAKKAKVESDLDEDDDALATTAKKTTTHSMPLPVAKKAKEEADVADDDDASPTPATIVKKPEAKHLAHIAAANKEEQARAAGDDDDDVAATPTSVAKKPPSSAVAQAKVEADAADDDDDASTRSAATIGKPGAKPGNARKVVAEKKANEEADVSDDDDASPTQGTLMKKPQAKHVAQPVSKKEKVDADAADDDEVSVAPATPLKRTQATHAEEAAARKKKAESALQEGADPDGADDAPAPAPPSRPKHLAAAHVAKSGVSALQEGGGAGDIGGDTASPPAPSVQPPATQVGSPKVTPAAEGSPASTGAGGADDLDLASQSPSLPLPDTPQAAEEVVAQLMPEDVVNTMAKQLEPPPDAVRPGTRASGGQLPHQYAAWVPGDDGPIAKKKEAALNAFEADLEDDDDKPAATPPPPPPKHRAAKRRGRGAAVASTAAAAKKPAAPSPPVPAARAAAPAKKAEKAKQEEDNVVYDDDDLPRHHRKPITAELQGGWRSFLKKAKATVKTHSPKLDPDVAIMESLYSSDGGLPKQYMAWTPPAPTTPAPADQDDAPDGQSQDSQDAPALLQLSIASPPGAPSAEEVERLISSSARGGHQALTPSASPSVFLERSADHTDAGLATAASAVLQAYAEVLKSQALRQLARARLTRPKLLALQQRLRTVDPLAHPGAALAKGKRAQAEQWCEFFKRKERSVAPLHKVLVQFQEASNRFANVSSQKIAVSEEVDARTQLEKAVEQDVQGLTALLATVRRSATSAALQHLERSLSAVPAGKEALLALGSAEAGWRDAHAEVGDALEAALRERSAVLQVERTKLASLKLVAATKDGALVQEQASLASAQRAVEAMRRKLSGIGAACDSALRTLERRRHAGHMEAHAVEMALKVLGPA